MHNLQISHYTHDTCSSLSLLSFIQLHTTTWQGLRWRPSMMPMFLKEPWPKVHYM
jgi:hypothetical protein